MDKLLMMVFVLLVGCSTAHPTEAPSGELPRLGDYIVTVEERGTWGNVEGTEWASCELDDHALRIVESTEDGLLVRHAPCPVILDGYDPVSGLAMLVPNRCEGGGHYATQDYGWGMFRDGQMFLFVKGTKTITCNGVEQYHDFIVHVHGFNAED